MWRWKSLERARARLPVTTMILILMYITLRARIASGVVTGSLCRGGIVNIRGGYSCVRLVQRKSSTELWRFHVKTSNNPSGHSWQHNDTHLRDTQHIYAQPDIWVHGDGHSQLRMNKSSNPIALWLLRISIWSTRNDRFWQRKHTYMDPYGTYLQRNTSPFLNYLVMRPH